MAAAIGMSPALLAGGGFLALLGMAVLAGAVVVVRRRSGRGSGLACTSLAETRPAPTWSGAGLVTCDGHAGSAVAVRDGSGGRLVQQAVGDGRVGREGDPRGAAATDELIGRLVDLAGDLVLAQGAGKLNRHAPHAERGA